MPVYFKKDDGYTSQCFEEVLDESMQEAINNFYLETGDSEPIDYSLDLDEVIRGIEGEIGITYGDHQEKINASGSTGGRAENLKLRYRPETMPDEIVEIVGHLEDAIDSMLEIQRKDPGQYFANERRIIWEDE